VLTGAGIGSRRRLSDAIKRGRVQVNGSLVEDFRHPVNRERDHITVDGKEVELRAKEAIVLMLNKPAGVVTTTSDERDRQTVLDLLPPKYRQLRLYPVGRLDKDTTGLILLTNDGNLTYRLTHPKFEHEKEYLFQIGGKLSPADKDRLKRGIKLEDGWTHPAVVREVNSPPFNYSITIHEGRKRQVHRMLAALGHSILTLKRVRMGNLTLGNLGEGKVRELSAHEINTLMTNNNANFPS
jgi:23S rRNA pseudouridine2605 synthase